MNGVWRTAGNAAVVLDGNNAVLELEYDGSSEGQAAHKFDGVNGKGKYRVEMRPATFLWRQPMRL